MNKTTLVYGAAGIGCILLALLINYLFPTDKQPVEQLIEEQEENVIFMHPSSEELSIQDPTPMLKFTDFGWTYSTPLGSRPNSKRIIKGAY